MKAALVAIVALNLADALTTVVGLHRGFIESAAVAGVLASALGIAGIFALGIAGLAVQLAVLARMTPAFRRVGVVLVMALSSVPVAANLGLLAAAR